MAAKAAIHAFLSNHAQNLSLVIPAKPPSFPRKRESPFSNHPSKITRLCAADNPGKAGGHPPFLRSTTHTVAISPKAPKYAPLFCLPVMPAQAGIHDFLSNHGK
jgi:hypothetical protein